MKSAIFNSIDDEKMPCISNKLKKPKINFSSSIL